MEMNARDRRKKFFYEEEFLFKLKNDMNNLIKEKLTLTRSVTNENLSKEKEKKEIKDNKNKILKKDIIENKKTIENITKNISQDNTTKELNNNDDAKILYNNEIKEERGQNNNNYDISKTKDVTEKNNDEIIEEKKVLITEINNNSKINRDLRNSFLKSDFSSKNNNYISNNLLYNNSQSNKKYLINLKKKFSDGNLIKKELIEKKILKSEDKISNVNRQSINQNIFNSHMIINHHKKIEHPYYSPLTLIKQQKYKIFVENDQFLEDKKRHEMEQKNNYKKRGLNEFGYPLCYYKRFIRRNNIANNTEET
jgi:hypothetical protein